MSAPLSIPTEQESISKKMQESISKKLKIFVLQRTPSYEQTSPTANTGLGGTVVYNTPYATNFDYYTAGYSMVPNPAGTYTTLFNDTPIPIWGTIPSSSLAFTGWSSSTVSPNASMQFTVSYGLAKNTTSSTLTYFIARLQSGQVLATSPTFIDAGVTTLSYILTLESQGIVFPGKVIGFGQDINLPYPSTNPSTPNEIINNFVRQDIYYAVIGQTPTAWAASQGLTFGTVTSVS